MNSTTAAMLQEVRSEFAEQGLALAIVELHNEPMEVFDRAGILRVSGSDDIRSLEDVISAFKKNSPHVPNDSLIRGQLEPNAARSQVPYNYLPSGASAV